MDCEMYGAGLHKLSLEHGRFALDSRVVIHCNLVPVDNVPERSNVLRPSILISTGNSKVSERHKKER